MKRSDIMIITFFLVVAVLAFGYAKLFLNQSYDKKYAVIYVDNKVYKTVLIPDGNYTENITVNNEFGENIVAIKNDGAIMLDADCHDKVCVKSGFIDKPGQTIVCLPHKLVVEIKGQSKSGNSVETDDVSY